MGVREGRWPLPTRHVRHVMRSWWAPMCLSDRPAPLLPGGAKGLRGWGWAGLGCAAEGRASSAGKREAELEWIAVSLRRDAARVMAVSRSRSGRGGRYV